MSFRRDLIKVAVGVARNNSTGAGLVLSSLSVIAHGGGLRPAFSAKISGVPRIGGHYRPYQVDSLDL